MLNLLIALTIGFILGVVLFYVILRFWLKNQLLNQPNAKGAALEEAEKLLEKNGYKIKEKNKSHTLITILNGKSHMGIVAADFVVEKNGKTFVVEVKTDVISADPLEPLTRRQLLEQQSAFSCPHSLLVDLTNQKIMEVSFEFPKVGIQERFIQIAIILFTLLLFSWFIWTMIQLKLF